jgi:2-octaprenyl-6-methoxyphenol hydroxylase
MYGSKRVFEALGLWPQLAGLAEPIQAVIVEDQGTSAAITYEAAEIADHPFGYGLETGALRRRLLELAQERPGIEIVAPARLVTIARSAAGIAATLDDGRELAAPLIVGADGRASTVRARAGLDGTARAYAQTALTLAIRHERPHGGRVREFLRRAGPLALLPIGDHLCSVTWVEPAGLARHLLSGPRAVLAATLAERLRGVLGAFEIAGEPTGHPLSVHQARRLVAPRVALIGDAAHGIHPIHAQGFNLAVRDVATLAEVLVEAARAGRDLGDPEILIRYDRLRRTDAWMIAAMTDGLNGLFSTDLGAAKLVRRIGLGALDRVRPLRHLAMRRGMGLSGDLPSLARGEMPAPARAPS